MPRVSAAFFSLGILFVLAGMTLGQYMAKANDFVLAPVHAHLNLIGWVTMGLYGTFFALTKSTYSPRLAWTVFLLTLTGVVIMIPALTMLLRTGDDATWGPIAGIAGGFAMLGALVFAVCAFRELFRSRTA
ncbi:MAG TPA: hypothetical protein VHC42_08205 [Rhizomicrobium sp.]|nr:hypothetical protein [Rhizomicrobium sp.]